MLGSVLIYSKRVQQMYNDAIKEAGLTASKLRLQKDKNTLDQYPAIKAKIDAVLAAMQSEMTATLNRATADAWALANRKNDYITKTVLGKTDLPDHITDRLFNPNLNAYKAFRSRVTDGMNLSQRIWKLVKPYRHELEAGLTEGINAGRSAAGMAREMQKYLKQPDVLFRRVRAQDGPLQLSRAAKAYNPGPGVYRSSFKNALRVTRTETNMSYRNADYNRWIDNPLVLGIEIKLSKMHPRYDICDPLQGSYPKTFQWAGWHPQCLCFAVPKLTDAKGVDQIEDEILGIGPPAKLQQVTEPPKAFYDYLDEHKDRLKKQKPYWLEDNPQYAGGAQPYDSPAALKKNVDKLERSGKDFGTDSLFSRQGRYTQERAVFQDNLIAGYLKPGSTNEGVSYFMGGAPATGKSSILETGVVKLPKGILVVDPDRIKALLPEYREMVDRGNTLAAHKVHEESSTLSKQIVRNAAAQKLDIVADGVGDGSYESVVKKVEQQKAAGKKVIAEYVTIDTETSVERATARAKASGREVPEDYIRAMHKEISKLVPRLAENGVFDELRLYNNEGARGSKPVLIFEQKGKKITVYNERLYKKFLAQALH